ncbi:MAG: phosphate ABC transporter substrate-binding protein PstS family protein [Anaerolineaceae bacterium]|nr:MAG: phosphate ABC transporter substrate-binding protein PstS family protein [Anaerolineaceae bacterium]
MRLKVVVLFILLLSLVVACGGQETSQAPSEAPAIEGVAEISSTASEEDAPAEEVEVAEEEAVKEEESPEEEPATEEMTGMPMPDPLAVSGNVVSAGSSTVFPLAERMAERYQNEGYGGDITIDSIGSGAGFERFCVAGETDVSNASRPIKDSEVESCNGIGRAPIEFRVGTDALAVVVSVDNDFLEDATLEELAQIFSSAENWSDVRAEWPGEAIQRFIPGTDSGTFDYFTVEVFDEDPEPQLTASNLQQSEDDNVLVQGVGGSPYAIGYFGYAYAAENTDIVTPIAVEGVEATAEAVDANEYPLARPLFIYSDGTVMQDKPQVADYINFFLTYVNEEVVNVGYFPASDEVLEEARAKWIVAMAGEGKAVAEIVESAEETETAADLPVPDPLAVSGNVVSAGSSTVFPLAERMAERYQNEGFGGDITIDSIGSGAGFERFCVAGETDVSNASRPIKDSEVESCNGIGRAPIEFRVGTDALAVVVSMENDFLQDATLEELAQIFGSAENWSDVRSEWPGEAIQRFIPGTDSGTFDYFTEEVFDEDPEPQLTASNLQQSEDDNVLVQGVAGSPYAIGYFGYAYAAENTDLVTPIAVEGVEATAEAVDANEYPLARPLFIYSDAQVMQDKAQVADYINFFLTYVNEEVVDVGYFPASDDALEESRTKWLEAMGN